MPHNHRREIAARRTAFLQVAATFLGCARNERAKNAAEAYFRRAGKCFEDAGDFNQAIDAYNHAKDFSRVAELYRDMGKIDQAVATVKNHDRDIKPNVAQRVISVMGKIDQAVATVKNHDRDINPNVAQRVISVTGNTDQAVATVKNHDRDINPNVAQRVIGVARLFYFKKGQFE
jgi:tetratricopeptide (TPR) repeat protein